VSDAILLSPANLECTDGLEVLRFQVKRASAVLKRNERRADGHTG